MDKVVRLGDMTQNGRTFGVYCRIQYKDGRLSISGVEGPRRGGDCYGSCGQIEMGLNPAEITPAPGWTLNSITAFLEAWRRWHLNDLRAGTPKQEEWLRANPVTAVYPESHFTKASDALAAAGLNPDTSVNPPYKYGNAWLYEHVPPSVLEYFEGLPTTDKEPAWV